MCHTKGNWGDWKTGSSLTKFLDKSEDGSRRLSTHGTVIVRTLLLKQVLFLKLKLTNLGVLEAFWTLRSVPCHHVYQ